MSRFAISVFLIIFILLSFKSYSLGIPSTPSASVSGKTVTLTWGTVTGAVYYQLGYRDGYGSWGTSYGKYYNGSQTWKNAPYLIQRNYRMRACDNVTCYSWSEASNQINIFPVPEPPPIPSASVSGNNNYLNWSVVDYALSYQVEVSYNNGGWFNQGSTSNTNQSWPNLNEGTRKFRVNACNKEGCSDWSAVSNSVEVLKPIPTTPSAPNAVVNINTLSLSWFTVSGADYYKLEFRDGNGSWDASNKNYYGNINVWNNTESIINRSYRLSACNSSGCSQWSSPSNAVSIYPRPKTPKNLETTFSENTTTLTWNEVAEAEYFKVQYHDGNGIWDTSGSHIKGTEQVWNSSVNVVRYYRLSGCNESGCSSWSDVSVVKVGIPSSLSVNYNDNTLILSWKTVLGAVDYQMEYRDGSESWKGAYGRYYNGSQTWPNPPYLNKRSYRLRSCDNSTCYDWSKASNTVTIPPPIPSATINWSPSKISYGESSELKWSSHNALSCELDRMDKGLAGSRITSNNTENKTVNFTCTGESDQVVIVTATLTVIPEVETPTFIPNGGAIKARYPIALKSNDPLIKYAILNKTGDCSGEFEWQTYLQPDGYILLDKSKRICTKAVSIDGTESEIVFSDFDIASDKKVIFIHTDLLGSPVVETNKAGVIQ